MKSKSSVKAKYLLEFVLLEGKSRKIMSALEDAFGEVTLIECFQSFYRYKIHKDEALSKLFGFLEKNVNEA